MTLEARADEYIATIRPSDWHKESDIWEAARKLLVREFEEVEAKYAELVEAADGVLNGMSHISMLNLKMALLAVKGETDER